VHRAYLGVGRRRRPAPLLAAPCRGVPGRSPVTRWARPTRPSMCLAPWSLYGRRQQGRGASARDRGADSHRLLGCASLASQPEQFAPSDGSLDKHPARWPGVFRLTVHRSMSPTDLFWVSVHRSRTEQVRSIVPELRGLVSTPAPSSGESRVGAGGAVPVRGAWNTALLQLRRRRGAVLQVMVGPNAARATGPAPSSGREVRRSRVGVI
jgi:hypothetical protein